MKGKCGPAAASTTGSLQFFGMFSCLVYLETGFTTGTAAQTLQVCGSDVRSKQSSTAKVLEVPGMAPAPTQGVLTERRQYLLWGHMSLLCQTALEEAVSHS